MFQHFIITRFNIKSKSCNKLQSDDWIKYRLKIFEKYCYPSIISQSTNNFEWIMLFDGETTDKNLLKKFKKVQPVFIFEYEKYGVNQYVYRKIIQKEIEKRIEKDWIITTRLDSDDCLHHDYIKTIQSFFDQKEKLIHFSNGYIFNPIKRELRLAHFKGITGFISTIENVNNGLRTCYCDKHAQVHKFFPILDQIENETPMWLQIIHENNTSSGLQGIKIIDLEKFGISDYQI